MPRVKNALLRYKVIEQRLRNRFRPYPGIEELRSCCEEALYGSVDGKNISRSTIEKDLREMRMEFDAPIQYDTHHQGYYLSDPDYSSDQIPLSEDDKAALRFAALTLNQYRNVGVFNQFQSAINKIFERVTLSNELEDEDIGRWVQFESQPAYPGSQWLSLLFQCIKERAAVEMVYHSYHSDQIKRYLIHPYLLKEYRGRWYIVAFDTRQEKVRTFELGRIQHIDTLTSSFEVWEGFDPDKFFKHAFGITVSEGEPEKVVLNFEEGEWRYLSDTPLHPTQRLIKKEQGRVWIELEVYVTVELIMTIQSYGNKVIWEKEGFANTATPS